MAVFAARYGFVFKAHEKGGCEPLGARGAPLYRIERGFLVGSDFVRRLAQLNRRARENCDAWNAKFSNKLHTSRRELYAVEAPLLKPLPVHVPEVYRIATRIVDAEGYVHSNRVRRIKLADPPRPRDRRVAALLRELVDALVLVGIVRAILSLGPAYFC